MKKYLIGYFLGVSSVIGAAYAVGWQDLDPDFYKYAVQDVYFKEAVTSIIEDCFADEGSIVC
jgi:hypothetical protein